MNREISFYQYLTPEEQDLLDRSMQQVPCRKSQVVHRHGDSCVGLIFLCGRAGWRFPSCRKRGEITVFRIEKENLVFFQRPACFRAWSLKVISPQR